MRTPRVRYDLDPVVSEFIEEVTGGSSQDLLIGSEICVAAGLASRQLSHRCGEVIVAIKATADLRHKLTLVKKENGEVLPT